MKTEKMFDAVKEKLVAINENLDESQKVADSDVADVVEAFENDPDVIRLNEEKEELMRLLSDPNLMKQYRAARRAGERRQVTQKEKKKKKAKRRMAKKSRR
jgi:hypothetical protein